MNNNQDVAIFHNKFGLDNTVYGGIGPREVSDELLEFRTKFLDEELAEFKEGVAEGNIAKMADALVDLVYVAHGTAHILGLPWDELWADVQRANMTKRRAAVDGSDSKRGSSFDVIKPPGWIGPRTDEILEDYGFGETE